MGETFQSQSQITHKSPLDLTNIGGDYRQNEMLYYAIRFCYDLLDSTIGVMSSLFGIVNSIRPSVVSKMGILEHSSNYQKCIKKTNKIPEYARDFKNEYLFVRGIDELILARNLKIYIEEVIMRLRLQNKLHEENGGKIFIYQMILILVNFIIEYFNNPTEDRLKIIDWYFIDLIINKDKIIVRGFL